MINAYMIQEKIRKRKNVTVAGLQKEFSLDYREAKEFLNILMRKGWIESIPNGLEYTVTPKNMRLRKIERREVDALIEDLTPDCVTILLCIQRKADAGALHSDVSTALRFDGDLEESLKILNKHNLIHESDEKYFLSVSKETIKVFSSVAKIKKQGELSRRFMNKPEKADDTKALRKLFDELFDE